MIHAYNEFYLPIVQDLVANLFELAINVKKISLDNFSTILINSKYVKQIEEGNPILVTAKSPNEILGLILNEDPVNVVQDSYATPEYWVGHVLAYVSWYLNKSFSDIIKHYPLSKLVMDYFPYHEMDINQIMDKIASALPKKNKLKEYRESLNLSQSALAVISNVPLRTIRAYEQGTVEISKASGEVLYALSKELNCTIEELIK